MQIGVGWNYGYIKSNMSPISPAYRRLSEVGNNVKMEFSVGVSQ